MARSENMELEEKYQYWMNHAQYDLDTADSMCQTGRWLYVIFMCQQAIEKSVKSIYGLHLGYESIPRTHNIRRLINDFADKLPHKIAEETYTLFDYLTRYYLNNRYPDYIDDLVSQITENDAITALEQTKEVFAWLQTMKP